MKGEPMEKSRAIELLEHLAWDKDIDRNPYGDALNIAIEALKAQLSQEGTTSDLISRQAAIDAIEKMNIPEDMCVFEILSHIEVEIATLPTIQPVATDINVGDTISRQAVLDAIVQCTNCGDEDTLREYVLKHSLDNGWTGGILEALDAVKDLPSAQPERKKGRWLPDNNSVYEMRFICSECKESEVVPTIGFTKYKPIWDFCPNCGADMRGEKDG